MAFLRGAGLQVTRLVDDYETCRRVLAASGSTFIVPILLLPRPKRLATAAIYAFCRIADDIADDPEMNGTVAIPQRRADGLAAFGQGLADSLAGRAFHASSSTAAAVLRAVSDTVRRYEIPPVHLFDVIDGVTQDLSPPSFGRFEELEEYCRKVASAVGLAAVRVWGTRSSDVTAAAHACGVAFQLTNILRDVVEDAAIGRVYFPREDLDACGVVVENLRNGEGPGVQELFHRFLQRTAGFYEAARELDSMLSFDGRTAFRAMYGGYSSIFRRLIHAGRPIPRIRGRGRLRSLAAVLSAVIQGPSRLAVNGLCVDRNACTRAAHDEAIP